MIHIYVCVKYENQCDKHQIYLCVMNFVYNFSQEDITFWTLKSTVHKFSTNRHEYMKDITTATGIGLHLN